MLGLAAAPVLAARLNSSGAQSPPIVVAREGATVDAEKHVVRGAGEREVHEMLHGLTLREEAAW